ncbi:hypothetical protein AB5N19_04359 [Seiridium cardinale]
MPESISLARGMLIARWKLGHEAAYVASWEQPVLFNGFEYGSDSSLAAPPTWGLLVSPRLVQVYRGSSAVTQQP